MATRGLRARLNSTRSPMSTSTVRTTSTAVYGTMLRSTSTSSTVSGPCSAMTTSAWHTRTGRPSLRAWVDLSTLNTDPEVIRMYRSIIMMDPPEHDRLRALVSRVFTPRAVGALEPMVREVIVSLLSPFDGSDSFDAVADFGGPFPVEIISRMLGVPEGERQQIRHWLDVGLHREPGRMDPTPEGMQAQMESGLYFYELAEAKRHNPGDDMITRLTQVEVDRGDGQTTRLDNEEIAGFAGLLGGAGAETVTKLVGNAAYLFHKNPDQYQRSSTTPPRSPEPSRRSCVTTPRPSTRGATR